MDGAAAWISSTLSKRRASAPEPPMFG